MLTDKRIVLTGANGGIGREIASKLVDEGATLFLVGMNKEDLEQQAESLSGRHYVIEADISQAEDRTRLVEYCQTMESGIDILINCAGVGQFSAFKEMDTAQIDKILTVNLNSTILLIHAFLPVLLQQQSAQIINIGSIFGSIGYPGSTVYCASKFGLRGFSEALRRELLDTGVTVRYFAPRATKTAINDDAVVAMNKALGTKMDKATAVAQQFIDFLKTNKANAYLGWPEKLFVRINGLCPSVVEKSIRGQLATIKRYLQSSTGVKK